MLDGKSITLYVCPSDTILDVKARIEKKTGMRLRGLWLEWWGKRLDDECSLSVLGITKDVNLSLRGRLRGGGALKIVFDACDTKSHGVLQQEEILFALKSQGFYPTPELLEKSIHSLGLSLPLDLAGFEQLIRHLETTDCKRGLWAVPYARRGLTLRQLRAICSDVVMGWVKLQCDKFNQANADDIAAGCKHLMEANLYTLDKLLVRATTSLDPAARVDIPAEVLSAAGIPSAPEHDCCFSQLLNADGMVVDIFVSHFWGHPFERTVSALTNFAATVYEQLGKESADDVVFWICLFALNQHQAAKEVGLSPEQGPFNAALAKAGHAVMVLDAAAHPLKHIWWYVICVALMCWAHCPLSFCLHGCFDIGFVRT